MALAHRQEAADAPFPRALEFSSPSVEILRRHLQEPGKRQVLDLGAPSAANVAFLNQVSCRLHLEDFYRFLMMDRRAREGEDAGGGEEREGVAAELERALAYPRNVRFDLVFGWDIYCYLEQPTFAALMARVARSCRPGCLLYLVGSNLPRIPAAPARISIEPGNRVRYLAPGNGDSTSNPRYTPLALERMMPGFRLLHSFLLDEGIQEFIFSFG
ncbi:MAG: hypothetical protein R3286_11145 [Gammaproteobacteria bacterium]|nr:hypothetical protein [Gammaproteobacteria bacterium]